MAPWSRTARPGSWKTRRCCGRRLAATWSRCGAAPRCWWTTRTTPLRRPPVESAAVLSLLLDPLALGFMQRAILAGALVGAVTAVVGVFVVLRGLGFLG